MTDRTMGIIRLATGRRVTILMIMVAILVFGLVGQSRLKMSLLPELSYPTVTVRTQLEGAAPREIEDLVTKPIEEAVGTIKNLRTVRSVSRAGQSDVTLEFLWGTDMDYAGVDIREKLDMLQLPVDAERPVLLRFDPTTEPVIRLGLSDTGTNEGVSREERLKALRRHADERVSKDLESVAGVAAVKASGGLEEEIQVLVNQQRLAQLNLPIEEVASRLRAENVNLSGGRLQQGSEELLVRTVNEFESVDEIRNAVVAIRDQRPVYLKDVAQVREGHTEREAITRINGTEAVELALYKEGDANTVAVGEAVARRLETTRKTLPDGLQITKVYDQSKFIAQAIHEVMMAALIGGLLAALVIYLFLRNVWATVIVALSIPVSIVGTFILMYAAEINLNIMSLGGIALAVGLLVDNAIVVLENISRHREMDKSVMDAARTGSSEVGGAITASTLTTIAVFFPLVFIEGIAGQLFSDQALTITFALAFSLLVALTLIPMLSSLQGRTAQQAARERLADPHEPPSNRVSRVIRRIGAAPMWVIYAAAWSITRVVMGLGWILGLVFRPLSAVFRKTLDRFEAGYPGLVRGALANRVLVVAAAFAALAGSIALIPRLGVELIPQLSQGEFVIEAKLPPGTPIRRTDEVVSRIETVARGIEGVRRTYAVSGTGNRLDANPTEAGENTGQVNVVMAPDIGREGEARAMSNLRNELATIAGVELKFRRPELFTFSTPLEVEISGYNLDSLQSVSRQLASRMNDNDRFIDVRSSMEQGHPEVQIRFDHEKAARLGLPVRQIADRVVDKIRGEVATQYMIRDRKIDVLVRIPEEQRASIGEIRKLIVNPGSPRPVTLDDVARIEEAVGPSEIRRVAQERIALVSANLRYGDLGTAATVVRNMLGEINLPAGINARVAGQSEDMERSFQSMQFALLLAVFLVYLVMASQFESLIHPFVILFTIPLAAVGAILALWLTGTTISVVVFIGLMMLAGIVVNNAIVLVDLINQLREQGSSRHDAIIEAARARLRPILMTMLTTTLGLLPMAIGFGEGAEIRAPMAITVIGGLLVSTILTLVVIPVVYDLLDRRPERVAGAKQAHAGGYRA